MRYRSTIIAAVVVITCLIARRAAGQAMAYWDFEGPDTRTQMKDKSLLGGHDLQGHHFNIEAPPGFGRAHNFEDRHLWANNAGDLLDRPIGTITFRIRYALPIDDDFDLGRPILGFHEGQNNSGKGYIGFTGSNTIMAAFPDGGFVNAGGLVHDTWHTWILQTDGKVWRVFSRLDGADPIEHKEIEAKGGGWTEKGYTTFNRSRFWIGAREHVYTNDICCFCPGDIDDVAVFAYSLNDEERARIFAGDLPSVVAAARPFAPDSQRVRSGRWNHNAQWLFQTLLAADPADRLAIWKPALPALAATKNNLAIFDPEFGEIDRLADALGPKHLDLRLQISTDLMLLVPRGSFLCKIQWNRTKALIESGNVDNAIQAARLGVALALLSPQGPRRTALQSVAAARSSGWSPQNVEQLQTALLTMVEGDAAPAAGSAPIVDRLLRQAADQHAPQTENTPTARSLAYHSLYAGRVQQMSERIADALNQTRLDGPHLPSAFQQVAVFATVAGGSFETYSQLMTELVGNVAGDTSSPDAVPDADAPWYWLFQAIESGRATGNNGDQLPPEPALFAHATEPQRRKLLGQAATRWQQQVTDWADNAYAQGDAKWTVAFWLLRVRSAANSEQRAQGVQTFISKMLSRHSHETAQAALQVMHDRLTDAAAHRELKSAMISMSFRARQYDDCLRQLAELDQLQADAAVAHDARHTYWRAMSLIRLDRTDEAIASHERIAASDAGDDQRAGADLLIAWVHLQQRNTAKAGQTLQHVIDTYPHTPFGVQAASLVEALSDQ